MSENQLTREFTVTPAMLATAVGSGSVDVLATPQVAAMLEGVAAELAQRGLEEGITTVGSKITVEHLCPTLEGVTVRATAELIAQEGRVFRFRLEASDNAGVIATGTHERVSIKKDGFLSKAAARRRAGES